MTADAALAAAVKELMNISTSRALWRQHTPRRPRPHGGGHQDQLRVRIRWAFLRLAIQLISLQSIALQHWELSSMMGTALEPEIN